MDTVYSTNIGTDNGAGLQVQIPDKNLHDLAVLAQSGSIGNEQHDV